MITQENAVNYLRSLEVGVGDVISQAKAWKTIHQWCHENGIIDFIPLKNDASGIEKVIGFLEKLRDNQK